jgi:hypothetical protein
MREKGSDTQQHGIQDQHSPGDSKETSTGDYSTCREDIAEVEIASIQPCPIIPDYKEPTLSSLPIVVRTPEACFCIDGWHYIEHAKADGISAIRSHIYEIDLHSDTELAIRKVAIRVMPQGGKCSYAELVCNTHRLYQALRETSDELILFSHGGDRRGIGFIDSKENNIRSVLADRLGKSPNTISKYLQHGNYLNDETLQTLIDVNVKKGFFEAIQKDKQRLIDELESQQKAHDEIVNAVSARMLSLLEEFQASDLLVIVSDSTDPDEPPANENQPQPDLVRSPPLKLIEHKHWSGNPSATLEKQPTEDEIIQEFKNIGHSLIETAENQKLTTSKRIELFFNQIIRQSELIQHLKHLLAQQSTKPENQA